MQSAVQRFKLHYISSKTLVGRKWRHVNPLLQDKLFIFNCTRVVEEILLAERINSEMLFEEPLFINSRTFISVFQVACFPLKEYDPALVIAARMLLSQFEVIVESVLNSQFEYGMTWCFRNHLLRFINLHNQSIDADTAFLIESLAYRDCALKYIDTLKTDEKEELIDIVVKDYESNERSIDLYLGGVGNDTFILGL